MLIALLSAFLKDVVTTARREAFFTLPPNKRETEIKQVLGAEYPVAVREYLTTIVLICQLQRRLRLLKR